MKARKSRKQIERNVPMTEAMQLPGAAIYFDGKDLFFILDGTRIAKRGHPGTPQAKTWVSLEPGYEVISNDDHSQIQVEVFGARVH